MATLNYKLKYTKTTQSRIYFRFLKGRQYQTVMQTPIKIDPKEWDSKKQKLKAFKDTPTNTRDSINSKLTNFKAFILNADRLADINGDLVNTAWLKALTNEFFNTPDKSKKYRYLFEHYINHYIDNSHASYNYKKTFTTVLQRLIAFQGYKGKQYQFKELDIPFSKEFINWAENIEGYSPNVVNKTIKTFVHFIKNAKIEKIKINTDYETFSLSKTKRENLDIYLTPGDIEQIKKYKAPTPLMQNVKNLWLVGLYSGLRVSDLMRFNNPNGILPGDEVKKVVIDLRNVLPVIKEGNIEIVALKTKQLCVIPIHKDIKELLPIIKPIKDTKFNLYIKRIAEALEWDMLTNGYLFQESVKRKVYGLYPRHKLVSSHIMRRSYATNRVEEDKDTLIEVASATGHASTSQLENYLKTTKKQHADKKQKQWIEEENTRKQNNTHEN